MLSSFDYAKRISIKAIVYTDPLFGSGAFPMRIPPLLLLSFVLIAPSYEKVFITVVTTPTAKLIQKLDWIILNRKKQRNRRRFGR